MVLNKIVIEKNEIILVIEDKLWEGNTGEILRDIFEKEIYALFPSTTLFNFIQIISFI